MRKERKPLDIQRWYSILGEEWVRLARIYGAEHGRYPEEDGVCISVSMWV